MKRKMAIVILLVAILGSIVGCGSDSASETARMDISMSRKDAVNIGGSNVKVEIVRPIPSGGELPKRDQRTMAQIKKFVETSGKEIIAVTTHTSEGYVVGAEIYYR